MSELITTQMANLPATIDDLSKFILVGNDKLQAVRAEISAIKKLGLAKEVHEQKLREGQDIADMVTLAKLKMGELLSKLPKSTSGNGSNQYQKKSAEIDTPVEFSQTESEKPSGKPKSEVITEIGLTQKQAERLQQMAKNPEAVYSAMTKAREDGDIVSQSQILREIKATEKAAKIEQSKADIAAQYHDNTELKARLIVGDGINFKPNEPYNLLLTDPPYSTDVDDIETFARSWLPNALNYVRDNGFAYVFIGAYPNELRAYLNITLPQHLTLAQVLIWTYRNTLGNNPKDRYKQNYQACLFYRGKNAPNLDCPITNEQWAVQDINAPDGRIGDRYHAWQKPMDIAERFIRHSTKAGDTVFDPFACTGTFLLAAVKLGRKAYGFELNPDNAKIAFERGVENGG